MHSICNSKYSVPKKLPIVVHNGSSYDYHFIINELAEEFQKQFTCLGDNTEEYITLTVPKEKEATTIDKNKKEITKNILQERNYNLLIAQDLWQAHYQILSIIFLKEFIELNLNLDMMIKNLKHVELNKSIATVFLNT